MSTLEIPEVVHFVGSIYLLMKCALWNYDHWQIQLGEVPPPPPPLLPPSNR